MKWSAALWLFPSLLWGAAASAIDVAVDEKRRRNHVVDSLDLLLYVLLESCYLFSSFSHNYFSQRRPSKDYPFRLPVFVGSASAVSSLIVHFSSVMSLMYVHTRFVCV